MGTVSGELSRRRTCPTKLEYPVAYLVLICCKRRPRRCSLLSLRLIAFLRCALSARGFHVGQPRLSGVTGIPGHAHQPVAAGHRSPSAGEWASQNGGPFITRCDTPADEAQ